MIATIRRWAEAVDRARRLEHALRCIATVSVIAEQPCFAAGSREQAIVRMRNTARMALGMRPEYWRDVAISPDTARRAAGEM